MDRSIKFEFLKINVAPDEPVEKKIRPKIKVEGIELGEWITEIVYYDEYERPARSDLVNKQGVIVARRFRVFLATSLVQSFMTLGGPANANSIKDFDPNEIFFITDHDPQGNPKRPRFLCLDKNGDLIMVGKSPFLVDTFLASQKTETKMIYNGAFKQKAYIKIFQCDNCAKQTGNTKVVYIW